MLPNAQGKVIFLYDDKKHSYEGQWSNGFMHG